MIYTTPSGNQNIIDLDPEIIIGMRLNNFTWEECITRHNAYLQRDVPTSHITNAQKLRSSEEWLKAIEEYWDRYYGYKLQPRTKAAQRLGYHIEVNHPIVETYGIEIEFFSQTDRSEIKEEFENRGIGARNGDYRDWNREDWVVKTDGSIEPPDNTYGCEIASPVLNHAIVDDEIKRACRILKDADAKVNRSCGLHVHMGEHNFTGTRRSKIAYEFIRNEATIDQLMPSSRRRNNNSYCEGWGNDIPYYHQKLKDKTSRTEVRNVVNHNGRYTKLNMQTPYTTIESRQHSGTTNFKKIVLWKDFVVGLCEYAIQKPFSDLTEPEPVDTLIENIAEYVAEEKQDEFKTFYHQRYQRFQDSSNRAERREYERDNEEIPY